MEKMKVVKDTQIIIRLTKEEKEKFKIECLKNEETFQRVLRNYIKNYIQVNN